MTTKRIKLSSTLTNYFIYYAPIISLLLTSVGVISEDFVLLLIMIPVTILLVVLSFYVVHAEIDFDYLYIKRWNNDTKIDLLDIKKVGQFSIGVGLLATSVVFKVNNGSKNIIILSLIGSFTFNEMENIDEIILKRKRNKKKL